MAQRYKEKTPVKWLGEGTFGKVCVVFDTVDRRPFAMKCNKVEHASDGIHASTIREIYALRRLAHPNIIVLFDIFGERNDLILELGDLNLSGAIKSRVHLDAERVLLHLCRGLEHCHSNSIMHRDLKPVNIVLCGNVAKIVDFGQMRFFYKDGRAYTRVAGTMWYRSPEDMLSDGKYDEKVDMWAVGCIYGEIIHKQALFNGSSEVEMLFQIFSYLGSAPYREFQEYAHYSPTLLPAFSTPKHDNTQLDFLLEANPKRRPSARAAREHFERVIGGRDHDWTRLKRSWSATTPKRRATQRSTDIFAVQTVVNAHMRFILVEWLLEVGFKFKLTPETRVLGIAILDDYLRQVCIQRSDLQLVGMMALSIASKFEEEYAPEMRDWVYISDTAYTIDQCIAMEKRMCETLMFLVDTSRLRLISRIASRIDPSEQDFAFLSLSCLLLSAAQPSHRTIVDACVTHVHRLRRRKKVEDHPLHAVIDEKMRRLVANKSYLLKDIPPPHCIPP